MDVNATSGGTSTGSGTGTPPSSGLLSGITDTFRNGINKIQRAGGPLRQPSPYEDETVIKQTFKDFKKLCFEDRHVFERQWQRAINYERKRQWIWFNSKVGEWQDKRLARWIPKPVIDKCGESIQALVATFAATRLGVKCRPRGENPDNLATATVADLLEPFIAEEHNLESIIPQFDHLLCLLGNGVLHPYWERDPHGHKIDMPAVECPQCRSQATWDLGPDDECPTCGTPMQMAVGPTGAVITRPEAIGRGRTDALSMLEFAFPFTIQKWDDLPGAIRMRWRDKTYYENHPDLKDVAAKINFNGTASERSLQIWRGLPLLNDMGGSTAGGFGTGQTPQAPGIGEFEMWLKPTETFPDGLVVRITDDEQIIHLEKAEGLPGPFPYKDATGNPLFPFVHAAYKEVSGRILGEGALDSVIPIQDQINQLMSLIQMIVQRTANPIWLEPKGANVQKFTGEPGIVVKYDPLAAGGNAKPERIGGEDIPGTLFTLMEQLYKVFEEGVGTFDIIKGQKPTGVEAFSALQLLVERSQSRFSSVFKARAHAYKEWYQIALELERQFGPENRNEAVLGPNRSYIFKHFKKAQLQGSITMIVEDNASVPKTTLGLRAALEQARTMGLLDVQDPDQRYFALVTLGIPELDPALDTQVQSAHRKQDEFEAFFKETRFMNPKAIMPLTLKPWHDPRVHLRECVKWSNSDSMVELFLKYPQAEMIVGAYITEINMVMGILPMGNTPTNAHALQVQPKPGAGGPGGNDGGQPGGEKPNNGSPMANSNRETSNPADIPKGNGEGAQNQGPV